MKQKPTHRKKCPKLYRVVSSLSAGELRRNVEYELGTVIGLLSLTELELRAGGKVRRGS